MPRQENTKDVILYESMKLFATKGFDAVKITEIADAVGCVPSALYKHYPDKQSIAEALLEKSAELYGNTQGVMTLDFTKHPETKEKLLAMDAEAFGDFILENFDLGYQSERGNLFRKIMVLEQFKNPMLADAYDDRYVFQQIDRFTKVFEMFKEAGRLPDGNPHALACMLTLPIATLFGVIDRDVEKKDRAYEVVKEVSSEIFRKYIV